MSSSFKKLSLVYVPDTVLLQVAEPVAQVTDEIRYYLDEMVRVMYEEGGIGLAANQVGLLHRLVVMDCTGADEDSVIYKMVNPEITWTSDDTSTLNEGCLSIPTAKAEITRPSEVTVKYLDENGNPHEMTMDGLLATCIQHEVDHLNGVLFIDYLSKLKRSMLLKKAEKFNRLHQE